MNAVASTETPSLRRLRWLCRRGMRELDLLLLSYLDARYEQAPQEEQRAFVALLNEDDPVLWVWVSGAQPEPSGLTGELVARLRAYR